MVLRGWHFQHGGERVMSMDPLDVPPAGVDSTFPITPATALPPPPPLAVRWVQYVDVAADGRRLPT